MAIETIQWVPDIQVRAKPDIRVDGIQLISAANHRLKEKEA
jgi:hypothetical protein